MLTAFDGLNKEAVRYRLQEEKITFALEDLYDRGYDVVGLALYKLNLANRERKRTGLQKIDLDIDRTMVYSPFWYKYDGQPLPAVGCLPDANFYGRTNWLKAVLPDPSKQEQVARKVLKRLSIDFDEYAKRYMDRLAWELEYPTDEEELESSQNDNSTNGT